jgi:hypothetical protein
MPLTVDRVKDMRALLTVFAPPADNLLSAVAMLLTAAATAASGAGDTAESEPIEGRETAPKGDCGATNALRDNLRCSGRYGSCANARCRARARSSAVCGAAGRPTAGVAKPTSAGELLKGKHPCKPTEGGAADRDTREESTSMAAMPLFPMEPAVASAELQVGKPAAVVRGVLAAALMERVVGAAAEEMPGLGDVRVGMPCRREWLMRAAQMESLEKRLNSLPSLATAAQLTEDTRAVVHCPAASEGRSARAPGALLARAKHRGATFVALLIVATVSRVAQGDSARGDSATPEATVADLAADS